MEKPCLVFWLNFGLLTLDVCLNKSKLWLFSVESNIHNLKLQQLCDMKVGKFDEIMEKKLKDAMYLDLLMVRSCFSILLLCTSVNFCTTTMSSVGIKNIIEKFITNFFSIDNICNILDEGYCRLVVVYIQQDGYNVHKTQERRKMPAYLWDPNHQ